MASQINVGSAPDDGTGDSLRVAFLKVNAAIFFDNVSSGISTTQLGVQNIDQTATRINIRNSQSADAWAIVGGVANVGQDFLSFFNVTTNTTLATFTRAGLFGVLFGADAVDVGANPGAALTMTTQSTNANGYIISNWYYSGGDKLARTGGSALITMATTGVGEGLNAGEMAFSTAPSGAPGTAPTWTKQLRLHTDVLGIEAITLLTMDVGAAVGAPTGLQYVEFKQSGQGQTGGLKFTSSTGTRIVDMSGSLIRFLNIGGSVIAASVDNSGGFLCNAGFACNGIATAQTSFASGGAAPAGGVGTAAGGWDTAAHRDAAITLLNNIRTALVNNGIMS